MRTAPPVARTRTRRRRKTSVSPPPVEVQIAGPRLVTAKGGDLAAIHRLLLAAFRGPSAAEFQAQQDEPGYEPENRLVVKDGDHVAAHLRLSRRMLHFQSLLVPAVRLMDLATSAESRGRGFASSLIAAAEKRARQSGVLLGLTRTRAPSLFARQGWAICGRHVFSTAGAHQVLAQLHATAEGVITPERVEDQADLLFREPPQAITVRPLRRIEMPAVLRLYRQALPARFGSPVRSDEYWEWLLNRRACDRIFIAVEGLEPTDPDQLLASIRGCAFVSDGRIVELLTETGRRDVAEHLVARVCADVSEQDQWHVRLDAPPDDPLHKLFEASGGRVNMLEDLGGEVYMAKIFDPRLMLEHLAPLLEERVRSANLPLPMHLGLELEDPKPLGRAQAVNTERLRMVFPGRGMTVRTDVASRPGLTLRRRDLTPLLLGHWNVCNRIASGDIRPAGKQAQRIASILFPKVPWWRPPLDELLA